MLNAEQQVEWEREYYANTSEIASIGVANPAYYTEAGAIEYRYLQGELDEAGRDAAYAELASYDNSKDIEKYFYRPSLLQTHNIVISGGSKTTTNYFSVNFEHSLGDLKGNDEKRVGMQLNSTFDINSRTARNPGVERSSARRRSRTGKRQEVHVAARMVGSVQVLARTDRGLPSSNRGRRAKDKRGSALQ